MLNRKIRLINLISILVLGTLSSITFGYASWQFNKSDNPVEVVNAGVTNNWIFHDPLPIEPGQTIEVDEDGNVSIDGQIVENAEITYPEAQDLHGGDVTMSIGVDEDGDLAVTKYAASNIAGNWFSSNATVNLPASVSINGTKYPILGLSEPLSMEVGGVIISKDISVNVPEGYEYVCDKAFNTISCVRNTTMTFYLPASLEYLGYQTFKMDINRLTVAINYSGTKEQFKTLITNSEYKYGSGYTFFTGASDYVSVTCKDGEVIYSPNGEYYSD
ncbi:MAG: hypothetical protein IJK27_04065 [Bacilli bacterium]|nr:hypothetical protein [Bacilli bacterium]